MNLRVISKLANSNNPKAQHALTQIFLKAAAAQQQLDREAARVRKLRTAALIVIGGAFVAAVERGNKEAVDLAERFSRAFERQQDIARLHAAVEAGAIPKALRPVNPADYKQRRKSPAAAAPVTTPAKPPTPATDTSANKEA